MPGGILIQPTNASIQANLSYQKQPRTVSEEPAEKSGVHTRKSPSLLLLSTLVLAIVFLIIPNVCAEGVRSGLDICANALIPSLFPYLVLSGILCPLLSICFGQTARASLIGALVIGWISGFPIGAVAVVRAYRQNSFDRETASRAIGICTAASPAFLIGYMGDSLYGCSRMGWQLYIYQIVLSAALLVPLLLRRQPTQTSDIPTRPTTSPNIAVIIKVAAERMLSLCATVVFFVVLRAVVLHFSHSIPVVIAGSFSELSGGLKDISVLFHNEYLSESTAGILSAALVGFGGLCVGMQVSAVIADTDLSMKYYWRYRTVLAVGLAAAAAWIP